MLNLKALASATLASDPYDHVLVPQFITDGPRTSVNRDFPEVPGPGSYNLDHLSFGPGFRALIDELRGPDMEDVIGHKFGIDLAGRPTTLTIRGHCRATDGKIHRDSAGKLVTVLIYMNDDWDADGGRLRLLRNDYDIEDYAVEVPPQEGTLLAFRCADNAWHGHTSYEGRRRSIQLNWVADDRHRKISLWRHRLSAFMKGLKRGH